MSTLVVTMTFDPTRVEQAHQHLRSDVMPWIVNQPGFLTGRWLSSEDGRRGLGIVEFESAATANAAARGPRNAPRDENRAWNIDSVDLVEQVGEA
jgi:hypothetical protein